MSSKKKIIEALLTGTADAETQREAAEMLEGKVLKPKLVKTLTFEKDGKIKRVKVGKDSEEEIEESYEKEGWRAV